MGFVRAVLWLALAGITALVICSPRPGHAQSWVTWTDIERWTYFYADRYGADPEDMLRIANCEDPDHDVMAVGKLGEVGPYQLHPRGIWTGTPQYAKGYKINDLEATVAAAAWVYSRGYAYTTRGWYWCANYGS